MDKSLVNLGPLEFVKLFKNATHVCTNSYHGVIFSIIVEKRSAGFRVRDSSRELIVSLTIEDIGNRVFEIYTDKNNIVRVCIDGIDYTVSKENGDPIRNGIHVIVYNKLSEKVIDAVAFDADRDYAITRNE